MINAISIMVSLLLLMVAAVLLGISMAEVSRVIAGA
jgi:hypothetical protein